MGGLPRSKALDGFRGAGEHHQLLTRLLGAMLPAHHDEHDLPWMTDPAGVAIMAAPRAPMVMATVERIRHVAQDRRAAGLAWGSWDSSPAFHYLRLFFAVFRRLIRARADYTREELATLVEVVTERGQLKAGAVVGHVERALGSEPPTGRLRAALEGLRIYNNAKLEERRQTLLGAEAPVSEPAEIIGESSWAKMARRAIASSGASESWAELLAHAATLTNPKPTSAWLAAQQERVVAAGGASVVTAVRDWFAEIAASGADLVGRHDDILRGLMWIVPKEEVDLLAKHASSSRYGVASMWALAASGSDAAARALFLALYEHPSKIVKRNARASLEEMAAARGLSFADLESAVTARAHARDFEAPTPGSLFAEIYADPSSDAARAVQADELIEAGDVRGEFISLQLLDEPTADQKKRIAALVKEHGREWLGPLEPVLQRKGLRFERGFPASGRLDLECGDALRPLVNHVAWSTFVELDANNRGDVPEGFLVAPHLHRSLKSLIGLSWADLAELCRGETSLRRVGIQYWGDPLSDSEREDIRAATGLPRVRELVVESIHADPAECSWLTESPLFAQLEIFDLAPGDAGPWLAEFTNRSQLEQMIVRPGYNESWHYKVERDGGGVSIIAKSKGTRGTDEVLGEVLDAIRRVPKAALRRLEVSHTGPWERTAAQLQPLVNYCASLDLDGLKLPKPKRG